MIKDKLGVNLTATEISKRHEIMAFRSPAMEAFFTHQLKLELAIVNSFGIKPDLLKGN